MEKEHQDKKWRKLTLVAWFLIDPVLWEFSLDGWVKYNTDGSSRRNSAWSSYNSCLRNDNGDIEYVKGETIEDTTNTVEAAKVIQEECNHCKKWLHKEVIIQTYSMLMYTV